VTAVDRNKRGYAEANHGSYIDVAAPGVRVWTALPGERQGFLSGTSFAAPFITAIAAATYNGTPMRTAPAPGAFHPKEEVIGRMTIERLSSGDPGGRDPAFGLGLAHAPASCAPPSRSSPQVAEEGAPAGPGPLVLTSGTPTWQAQVHKASAAP
jgi:subtilisin family serine protease